MHICTVSYSSSTSTTSTNRYLGRWFWCSGVETFQGLETQLEVRSIDASSKFRNSASEVHPKVHPKEFLFEEPSLNMPVCMTFESCRFDATACPVMAFQFEDETYN